MALLIIISLVLQTVNALKSNSINFSHFGRSFCDSRLQLKNYPSARFKTELEVVWLMDNIGSKSKNRKAAVLV